MQSANPATKLCDNSSDADDLLSVWTVVERLIWAACSTSKYFVDVNVSVEVIIANDLLQRL
jgi:hypothetical protein